MNTIHIDICLFGLNLKVNYIPGLPGQLYGPPENCYPPEPGEVELVDWNIDCSATFCETLEEEDLFDMNFQEAVDTLFDRRYDEVYEETAIVYEDNYIDYGP